MSYISSHIVVTCSHTLSKSVCHLADKHLREVTLKNYLSSFSYGLTIAANAFVLEEIDDVLKISRSCSRNL